MSAFVVNDKTINDSIAFMETLTNNNSWMLNPLSELGYDLSSRADRERLGKDLFNLNVDGVNERYGDNQAQAFRPLDFKFVDGISSTKRLNIYQCIKSLRCLLYQCSEGNVPEQNLFKALEEVVGRLDRHVVNSLPQYEKAEWD
jgi:hypothetical protein